MTPLVTVLVGRFEDSQKLENECHKGTKTTENTIDAHSASLLPIHRGAQNSKTEQAISVFILA